MSVAAATDDTINDFDTLHSPALISHLNRRRRIKLGAAIGAPSAAWISPRANFCRLACDTVSVHSANVLVNHFTGCAAPEARTPPDALLSTEFGFERFDMFFIVSKTVGWLLTPTNLIISLTVIGLLLLLTRLAGLGRKVLVIAALLLTFFAFIPVGYWLMVPLEQRFPVWDASRGAPDGIIVLGGSIYPEISSARGTGVFPAAADRLVAAAELARRYPDVPVIFTGGSATLAVGDDREADFAASIFIRLGLAPGRIMLERDSRNTAENAQFTARMVAPKAGQRWLLISSAYHLPRAVGLFRAAGFPIEPYPVDWLTQGEADYWRFGDKPLENLARIDNGAREWIGMLANRLTGKSIELFPAPL